MQKIVIRWEVREERLLRIAKLRGTVMGNEHNEITSRILLNSTLETISLAEKSKGVLIPLSNPPLKNGKEFSYFEVIFKNDEDLDKFIMLLNNKSSQWRLIILSEISFKLNIAIKNSLIYNLTKGVI